MLFVELFLTAKSEELIAGVVKMAPLGRLGEVSDIVGVLAFLVGREGGWVNGQVIRVSGGYSCVGSCYDTLAPHDATEAPLRAAACV